MLSFQKLRKKMTPPQPIIILTSPIEEKEDPLINQRSVSVQQTKLTGKYKHFQLSGDASIYCLYGIFIQT